MAIDRGSQLRLLKLLEDVYPSALSMQRELPIDEAVILPNLAYLEQHGLVAINWIATLAGKKPMNATITARGIDFLADDGGLSAILGIVTIKIHEDSIKALLIDRVEASQADPPTKSKLRQQIEALPAEALKTITTEGLKAGLAKMPDAIQWLQKLLGP